MKDALGHGSDPRGGPAHGSGVDQVGRTPLALPVWYHGSPIGEPGPTGPVHVGDAAAAKIALEARIGIPADGKGWNGDREYGKTLIAGTDTLAKLAKQGYHGGYPGTGYNSGGLNKPVPKEDYYPTDSRAYRATMGSKEAAVPFDAKPAVGQYNIVGRMNNTDNRPGTDNGANRQTHRTMTGGLYYKNVGEDSDSISAVVPDRTYLRKA
jgi:hypothetical protein